MTFHSSYFIDHVTRHLLDLNSIDSSALIQTKIIVPSQRFADALTKNLIDLSPAQTLLMPSIHTVMDIKRDHQHEIEWPQFLIIVQNLLSYPQFQPLNLSQDYYKLHVFYNFLNQLIFNNIDLDKKISDVPLNCLETWKIYGQTILDFIKSISDQLTARNYVLKAQGIIHAWRQFLNHAKSTSHPILLVGIIHPYPALKEIFDNLKSFPFVTVMKPITVDKSLNQICNHTSQDIEMIEFPSLDKEAFGIACLVRAGLHQGHNDIVLITQDMELQLAIKGQLRLWQINVDDPTPQHWQTSGLGRLIESISRLNLENLQSIIAFMHHPYSQIYLSYTEKNTLVYNLSLHRQKFNQLNEDPLILQQFYRYLPENTAVAFKKVISHIMSICTEWFDLKKNNYAPFQVWLKHHQHIMHQLINQEAFAWDQDQVRLWQQINQRFKAINCATLLDDTITYEGYYKILIGLFTDIQSIHSVVASQVKFINFHDSYILNSKYIICCGLNENIFPASDLVSYGLPLNWLEALIHKRHQDNQTSFNYLTSLPNICFTRARLRFGIAQLPSKWWQELDVYLTRSKKKSCHQQSSLEAITRLKHRINEPVTIKPFQWSIPQHLKILTLDTNDINDIKCDPYRFFIKHYLNIKIPQAQNDEFDAKKYGIFIHDLLAHSDSLQDFSKRSEQMLKENILSLAWQIKLKKIILWLENHNIFQLQNNSALLKQVRLNAAYRDITLAGIADQLINHHDSIDIVDFKTGTIPDITTIETGNSLHFPILNYCAENMGYAVKSAMYYDFKNHTIKSFDTAILKQAWVHTQTVLDQYLNPQFVLKSLSKSYYQNDRLERRSEWEHF